MSRVKIYVPRLNKNGKRFLSDLSDDGCVRKVLVVARMTLWASTTAHTPII